jgi:ABC-2 type transport system permease protein
VRLLRVELARLRMRRAVVLLVVGCFAVPALVWMSTYWNTREVSQAEKDQAAVQLQRELQDPGTQRPYERCLANPERYGIAPGDDAQSRCEDMLLPTLDGFLSRSPLSLEDELDNSGPAVAVLLALMLALIGTTFAGHDWNTGSLGNQLIFEPRRVRVWWAKALAVVLGGGVVGAASLLAYWGGLWLLANIRGIDVPHGVLSDVATYAARALLLAVGAALLAYALTMLFRNTVATLGVLFGINLLAPLLLSTSALSNAERWMPHVNFTAVLQGGTTYYDPDLTDCAGGICQVSLSATSALVYFGVVLLVVVVVSVWSFRRRDVP